MDDLDGRLQGPSAAPGTTSATTPAGWRLDLTRVGSVALYDPQGDWWATVTRHPERGWEPTGYRTPAARHPGVPTLNDALEHAIGAVAETGG